MRWTVHGEHTLQDTPWVRLRSLDVERPDGTRGDYHVVRLRDLAVTAAVDDRRRVLMMWRHRFVTDTWAWELPMGLVEDGERPVEAAARELEEETGWRPESMRELMYAQPANGITDSQHFVFRADGATRIGEPTERNESDRLEWIPLAAIPGMIARREIVSSATLVGVMALLLEQGAWATLLGA
ncbi:NUDIX domain-containing protein [Streptomyces sp. NBC_00203]|uniref:NUDIX domain-containing protein n=1 Tax=Streptomyces sp. NBC_00203 TaxID=2975680 RepID=UPI0032528BEE